MLLRPATLRNIERKVAPVPADGMFKVLRVSSTATEGAGFAAATTTVSATVPGRVQYIGNLNASERERIGVVRTDADFVISLKARTDVEPSDVLLMIAQTWAANTYYGLGETVIPTVDNGLTYEVRTAGQSGATQPTWPLTEDGTVLDGTITWVCRGLYKEFQVVQIMGPNTYGDYISRRVLCQLRQL